MLPTVASSLTDVLSDARTQSYAGPNLGGDILTPLAINQSLLANRKDNPHFKPAKQLFKWSRCSAAIGVTAFRLSHPRGGETFLMLRNKEPERAENNDSSFGCFELGFYRVNFVFGSRHLILVLIAHHFGNEN